MTSQDTSALPPLQIGMLLYPGFTLLDLVGPQTALGMHGQTHLVARDLAPVASDSGPSMLPTTTYEDCPRDLDVLFVPGGFGTAEVMADAEALRFLADRAPRARYVTAVCSGSLVLAAAGVLHGYRATSHWSTLHLLTALGIEVEAKRVVVDRNRVTGGGVTAGIDFGLVLLAKLRGEFAAKVTQLAMEYDPEPPFTAGSPEGAGPEVTAVARGIVEDSNLQVMRVIDAIRARANSRAEA